jgi:hypothetical protein
MNPLFLVPLKFIALAATGAALGVGWKVGSYLAETAIRKGGEFLDAKDEPQRSGPHPLLPDKGSD